MASGGTAREARLAAALRENLKRRKAAAGAATQDAGDTTSEDGEAKPAADDGANGRSTGGTAEAADGN